MPLARRLVQPAGLPFPIPQMPPLNLSRLGCWLIGERVTFAVFAGDPKDSAKTAMKYLRHACRFFDARRQRRRQSYSVWYGRFGDLLRLLSSLADRFAPCEKPAATREQKCMRLHVCPLSLATNVLHLNHEALPFCTGLGASTLPRMPPFPPSCRLTMVMLQSAPTLTCISTLAPFWTP